MKISLIIIFLLFFSVSASAQIEGMTQRPFGKNRVQYKDFEWKMKSSDNFEVYYYDYGNFISDYAILFAENEFPKLCETLGHTPEGKTRLFLYNSLGDLQQSNIGLVGEEKTIGGQTAFIKPIIEIPFTGSLNDFKKELKYGIIQTFLTEMMFGGSIKEILQSSALNAVPEWFLSGIAAHLSEGWSSEMDDYMRSTIDHRKLKRPHRLRDREARMVGHSIWNFIVLKYGEQNISNILNLTRVIKSETSSISSTLGIEFDVFLIEWRKFYKEQATKADKNYTKATWDKKLRKFNAKGRIFNELKIDPTGKYVAYSENVKGRTRVIVKNLKNNKQKVVLRANFQLNTQRINTELPLLAWSDDKQLAICYKRKGNTYFRIFKMKGERKPRKKFVYKQDREFFNVVTGFDFSADGSHLLLSSDRQGGVEVRAGKNDLSIYRLEDQNNENITDDLYDDTDPVFVGKSNSVVLFSSNRISDTLKLKNRGDFSKINDEYSLYLYNPAVSKVAVTRLTRTGAHHTQPFMADSSTVFFLSDENGINNLQKLELNPNKNLNKNLNKNTSNDTLNDSNDSLNNNLDNNLDNVSNNFNNKNNSYKIENITNYKQDIRSFSINTNTKDFVFRMLSGRREIIALKRNFDISLKEKTPITTRMELLQARGERNIIKEEIKKIEKKEEKSSIDTVLTKPYNPDIIDTDDYQFDPKILAEFKAKPALFLKNNNPNQPLKRIDIRGAYPYEARFTADQSITTLINDPLRGFGALAEINLSDLLENHRIKAGILGILDFKSSNYYLQYNYVAEKIDLSVRYDRKSLGVNFNTVQSQRYSSNKFSATAALPFTNAMRLSATGGYMDSRFVDINLVASAGVAPLSAPTVVRQYLHTKVEYLYDNTTNSGLNMMAGTRMRVFYEYNISLKLKESFSNLFVDIRNYQPINKDIIFATRFAFGAFGGAKPKVYMLGGMDNWVGAQKDGGGGKTDPLETAPNLDKSDLLFNEFATTLRGYNYNKLAGKNFFVINVELRFPIVKYLLKNSISSNFFKNLQITAFADAGTAWTKGYFWDKDNNLNTKNVVNPPFFVTVQNYKSPILMSVGGGIRTILSSYYIKIDAAWAVENFKLADKAMYYLTLGYDF